MLLKKYNLDEVIATIPDPKNDVFFIPEGMTKHVRFIGDFQSFIPLKIHSYVENDGRFDRYLTKICLDNDKCIYCKDINIYKQSYMALFLPVYETKENGSLIDGQRESIWKLPYMNVYNGFRHLHVQVKNTVKDYVFHISRNNNKYDIKYSYVLSFNNDIKPVSFNDDYFYNKLIGIYGDDNIAQFNNKESNVKDLNIKSSQSSESSKSGRGKNRNNNTNNINVPVIDGRLYNDLQTASPIDDAYK